MIGGIPKEERKEIQGILLTNCHMKNNFPTVPLQMQGVCICIYSILITDATSPLGAVASVRS